jgi:peptidoglycan hydrolase-like protein with peptidoglycan-binding domain
MKGKLLRKVASVSVAASMLALTAGPVLGQTIEELMAQIQALQAQLAALQGQTGTQPFTFTRDLRFGMRGEDVRALQNYLKSAGYFTATPTGYFGPVTRAAVAAWQAANGLPSTGFFGPLSRAKYQQLVAQASPTPTPTTSPTTSPTPTESPTPTPTPTLQGSEGTFKNVKQLSDVSGAVLREGQDGKKVMGVEFEASGSDLRIDRVHVMFAWDSGGTSSNRPWRYFKRVALYNGDDLIASKAAGSSDNWSDEGIISGFGNAKAYKMTFTGLGEVLRMGQKMNLYVAVSTQDTIDTADLAAIWKVRIPQDGIRAVDAAGINQFAPSTDLTDQFSFTTSVTGSLTLSYDSALNKSRVVEVNALNDTNDVEVVNFTLKAKDNDVRVLSLIANMSETFGGSNCVADGVRRFKLYRNGSLVKSVSAPSVLGATCDVTFGDLDFVVRQDTTDTLVIKADMKDTEGTTFVNGNTLKVNSVSVTAEDPTKGTGITPTGSVVGGTLAFFDKGIKVEFVSKSATKTFTADATGEFDQAEYVITFNVTAFGGDAYVLKGAQEADTPPAPGAGAKGAYYDLLSDTGDSSSAVEGTAVASLTSNATEQTNTFLVPDGQTKTFTLKVTVSASSTDQWTRAGLEAVHWATTDTSTSRYSYTYGLDEDWRTDLVFLNVF